MLRRTALVSMSLAILFLWIGTASAGEKPMSTLEFVQKRTGRRWTKVPRKVLAFYYTWYGRPERHGQWIHWADVRPEEHEIASSTHYPAKGAYDSYDPEIIDYHIDLAKSNGIDGFIATWWGQGTFDDGAFSVVLDRAAAKDFSATIYWETAPGTGEEQIAQAVEDLLYVLDRYGSHPAFLKVDDKPVIFVYGRVMGQVPMNSWSRIIPEVQKRYDGDFLLIADGYREGYARLFDGVHTYNPVGWVAGKSPDALRAVSATNDANAVALAKSHGKIAAITVIPGYDDTKIRKPGLKAVRRDGETYRILWEEAIKADPDWVLITSWNEWHEGSEIEPSWEDGDAYIRLTGEYTSRFKATPTSAVPVPESPAGLTPARRKTLQQAFEGSTVAILPDFSSDAVFWLAGTGIDLKELSWGEVLDPERFNARRYPVVVYGGEESYVQTVADAGDVDRALVRYLNEGGLLAALPSGPLPFYYNEARESVNNAPRFGLPLLGSGAGSDDGPRGWEQPPNDASLTFSIDTERLPDLPRTAPFPAAGDLRWRPSTDADIARGDVYLPLARLKDADGRVYGDGIVYIERKESEPKHGKGVYVWKGMSNTLKRDDLLFDVFQLIAQRMSVTR